MTLVFCYSLWRPYLNGNGLTLDNPQLFTHPSMRPSFFHQSFLPLFPCTSVTRCYRTFIPFKNNTRMFLACNLTVCCSQRRFVLHPPLHTSPHSDNTAICLVIHPSSNTFFPHLNSPFLSPFTQPRLSPPLPPSLPHHLSQEFHLSLHQPFHGNISMSFSSPLRLSLFFMNLGPLCCRLTSLPVAPRSCRTILSGWSDCSRCSQATNICFPPVPLSLYSADQHYRFKLPKAGCPYCGLNVQLGDITAKYAAANTWGVHWISGGKVETLCIKRVQGSSEQINMAVLNLP